MGNPNYYFSFSTGFLFLKRKSVFISNPAIIEILLNHDDNKRKERIDG